MEALANLVPALMTVVCTEGYHCGGSSEIKYHYVPSWDACLQALEVTQIETPASEDEAPFAMMATCVMVDPDDIK